MAPPTGNTVAFVAEDPPQAMPGPQADRNRSGWAGRIMSRQSNRNFPKTRFNQGMRRGKLMAKECTGILLCIAAALQTTRGKELAWSRSAFGGENALSDWIMLVETLLQWEMWLKSDELPRNEVINAENKHRYIMYLVKKVGRRNQGMGMKVAKFHQIMHIADDILNFGVPMEVDTGANESGHKPAKKTAMLTQQLQAQLVP